MCIRDRGRSHFQQGIGCRVKASGFDIDDHGQEAAKAFPDNEWRGVGQDDSSQRSISPALMGMTVLSPSSGRLAGTGLGFWLNVILPAFLGSP